MPVRHTVDTGRGLIAGDHLRLVQHRPDPVADSLQRIRQPLERIRNGTLGDRQAEQLAHDPAEPLEANMVAVMQIEQKRVDVSPERRARCHPLRRIGSEPAVASGAAASKQFDACGVRRDRGDVDMIIAPARMLTLSGDIPAAVDAVSCPALHGLVRIIRQPPRGAWARGTGLLLAPLARAIGLRTRGGRHM